MKNSGSIVEAILESSVEKPLRHSSMVLSRLNQWRLFIVGLILNDVLMIAFAFRLAYWVRFELNIPLFQLDAIPSLAFYQQLVFIMIPVMVIIFAIAGLYNRHNLFGGTQEYSLVFNSTTLGIFLVVAVGFLIPDFILARAWLVLSWVFAILLISIGRFTLRRVIYHLRYSGYFLSPALLVGGNDEGQMLASQLLRWKTSGLYVLGFLDNQSPKGTELVGDLKVLGRIDDVEQIVAQNDVEDIIIASSCLSREQIYSIFSRYGVSKDINVRLSSGLYEIITTGLKVQEFAYVPLVEINKARLTGIDSVLKFLLDYVIILPGMLLAGPLCLLIALAIKLDSPGPAVYRRNVMGVNGSKFDAFKFRTMYTNGAEILAKHPELVEELELNHKLKDDPRVTRVGKLLRKTSLDELPQLINVLRREMSLVGPRMISPPEMEKYAQYGMNLLTVKPGITGLWQVSGRSDISYAERVRLDMYYIRNWSIWLDLQLLFQTIPAVLFRRGAY